MKVVSTLATVLILGWGQLMGQCTGGTNAGPLNPAPSTVNQTMTVSPGNYYTLTVPAATGCNFPTYTFSFCPSEGGSAGFDTQISLLDNTGALVASNDDFCGLQSRLDWTPTSAGTYRVLVNEFFCSNGGGNITLGYFHTAPPTPHPQYSLVGNATGSTPTNCITLTSNANSQLGCAWDLVNPLNFSSNFSIDYMVNLGSNDGGADGVTFMVHNDPRGQCACGNFGGALGATGVSNSLIVEIDTYMNTEDRDDGMPSVLCFGGPEPDHLDIWVNGVVNPPGGACPTTPGARIIPNAVELIDGGNPYNVENGLDHVFRIQWTAGNPGTLVATLMDASATTAYGSVSHSFDPLTLFGTNTPISGFSAATGGLSNQHSFCGPAPILAVDLLAFEAQKEGEAVALTWHTGPESDPATFFIERSTQAGIWESFYQTPSQTGQSASHEGIQYTAQDLQPRNGLNFYRLKMVDQNGEISYSEVRQVEFSQEAQFQVFPNPVQDQLQISAFAQEDLPAQLEVYDSRLQKVAAFTLSQTQTEIPFADQAQGVYFIRIKGKKGVYHLPAIVKQ